MDFLLPSIYKPFYINVLFVQIGSNTFRTIIDVYNGIGVLNTKSKKYNIGSITIATEHDGNKILGNKTININRNKPLFMTTYKESITTFYYTYHIASMAVPKCKRVIIKYNEPKNDYNTTLNGAFDLDINVENSYSSETIEPFYLITRGSGQYAIYGEEQSQNFKECVENKTGGFLYYVVNEAFYKYFIEPEASGTTGGSDYKTYNNNEIPAITGETERIQYDLYPNFVDYDGNSAGNGGANWVPNSMSYSDSTKYCKTTPFFRMYPSIKSEPTYYKIIEGTTRKTRKVAPFATQVIYNSGKLSLKTNPDSYPSDKAVFYLIAVKSPLTQLSEENYNIELTNGSIIRPEQNYITYIKYIRKLEIKIVS